MAYGKMVLRWIKRLLSDAKGEPSTRLHLAWFFSFILAGYVIYGIYKGISLQNDLVQSFMIGIATMCGISIFDKKKE